MAKPISIVLVGLGGYGEFYIRALLDHRDDQRFRIVGGVTRSCRCPRKLHQYGAAAFPDLDSFYKNQRADLAVISSPIHLHAELTCLALSHGSHVLCEKPAAATVQDVNRMITVRDRASRLVAIGYQWSFRPPIQQLKADLMAGIFGRPLRARCLCLWPRDLTYYSRNDWAGAKQDAAGRWILDSPVNNAMAHSLHNLLYLLGDQVDRAVEPVEVCAELYRANDIENFDTAVARIKTAAGTEVLFVGSHAVSENVDPRFAIECERATIEYAGPGSDIVASGVDGSTRSYEDPAAGDQTEKLWQTLAAVESGQPVVCGLEAARSQVVCVSELQDAWPDIAVFPPQLVRRSGPTDQQLIWVEGLSQMLHSCYEQFALPGELGVNWVLE